MKMGWSNVIVVCFLVRVTQCSAMIRSEIDDFRNFLDQTSKLDETLKKGTINPHDFDEDEPVSEHAWEESGKFEGDLILNERQRRLIVEDVAEGLSRNGLRDSTKRWPNNEIIYYIQREHFSGDQVQAIENGIEDLAQASCIKFKPYKKGDRDAVVIQGSRRGCFSQVGYQGGYQVLNLSARHPVGRGCFRHGTVIHEMLHTLGFYHMQSSPDRDDYIDVLWENIIEPARHNFRKYNAFSVTDFGVGYDYDSVLHYSRRAFSANGRDTLVPKQGASIGQRAGLSDKDTQKLNKMYCDADSNDDEADEKIPPKTVTKKKKPKNKPFEGHGIGYHQGKTVVIKLPAAETVKLSDAPTIHVFDSFSKTPQAVSPEAVAEGIEIGIGKEIDFKYRIPSAFTTSEYKKSTSPLVSTSEKAELNPKINKEHEENLPKLSNVFGSTERPMKNTDTKISKESSVERDTDHGSREKIDYHISEAFDRLGKIIKTHVYPSQSPNLEAYKSSYDLSNYLKSIPKFKSGPAVLRVDKHFQSFLPIKEMKEDVKNERNIVDPVQGPEIVEKSEEESHVPHIPLVTFPEVKADPEQVDYSYSTSFPFKDLYKVKNEKFVTADYATPEHINDKHDYSNIYYPKSQEDESNDKPQLFGYNAPLYDNWYKTDEDKHTIDKYGHESYTFPSSEEISSSQQKLKKNAALGNARTNKSSAQAGKKAYKLFGLLVPLTHDWFKVDFNPHQRSFLIEKLESYNDNR